GQGRRRGPAVQEMPIGKELTDSFAYRKFRIGPAHRVQVPRRGDQDREAVFEGSAKTKAGQGRVVGLSPRALRALRPQKAAQNKDRLTAGALWPDSGRVFAREDGSPIMPEYPSRLLEKV